MKYVLSFFSVLIATMIVVVQGDLSLHKEMHDWYCKVDADRMETIFCQNWYYYLDTKDTENFSCPLKNSPEEKSAFDNHAKTMHETWCARIGNSEKQPCLAWKKVLSSSEGGQRYGGTQSRISGGEL